MTWKNKIGSVLQLPLLLLVIGSFVASIYASYRNIMGVTFRTPITIGVVIILYIVGRFLANSE
jgi:hypothetical protein